MTPTKLPKARPAITMALMLAVSSTAATTRAMGLAPTGKAVMVSQVVLASGQLEVFEPVVGLNSVLVVDNFVGRERASEVLLHHPAVLENVTVGKADSDVAICIQVPPSAPVGAVIHRWLRSSPHPVGEARPTTEVASTRRTALRPANSATKGLAARGAGDRFWHERNLINRSAERGTRTCL